jgi:hypothetical protein
MKVGDLPAICASNITHPVVVHWFPRSVRPATAGPQVSSAVTAGMFVSGEPLQPAKQADDGRPASVAAGGRVVGTSADLLWAVLTSAYGQLKARFLKVTDITTELDQLTIDRAGQLAGLKGYVTNLPTSRMDGAAVIAACHDLWKVEQLFA